MRNFLHNAILSINDALGLYYENRNNVLNEVVPTHTSVQYLEGSRAENLSDAIDEKIHEIKFGKFVNWLQRLNKLDVNGLRENYNISLNYLEKNMNLSRLLGVDESDSSTETLDDLDNIMSWDWRRMLDNKLLTMDFVERHIDLDEAGPQSLPWDWWNMSKNELLTMDFIERHMDFPWNWEWISLNPSLTMDFVERHMHLILFDFDESLLQDFNRFMELNWGIMSENSSLTMEFVESHMIFPWKWEWICVNPPLDMDFVERHMNFPWSWCNMSTNPSLTMDFVERHMDLACAHAEAGEGTPRAQTLPWNWGWMLCNDSLTEDFVERHMDLPWN